MICYHRSDMYTRINPGVKEEGRAAKFPIGAFKTCSLTNVGIATLETLVPASLRGQLAEVL